MPEILPSKTIIGQSTAIQELNHMIQRVAASKTNILIYGESGTGKELVARQIHESGPLKDFPFVPVNCGAIPENLIETEMFGHTRGSFTGAVSDKTGLFEVAHRGTLFLDEIGELSLPMQVKLLRVIQERVFRKVGGVEDIRVDVRIIAATNRNLEAAVTQGTFREDLFYRLNVILIRTPALRDRRGDVAILAKHFLKKYSKRNLKPITDFEPEVLKTLEAYPWPGNVRELENCIERVATMESGEIVTLASLPQQVLVTGQSSIPSNQSKREGVHLPAPNFQNGKINLEQILSDVERTYIVAALEHAGGVKKQAAELLGITFRSMRYKLLKLGL